MPQIVTVRISKWTLSSRVSKVSRNSMPPTSAANAGEWYSRRGSLGDAYGNWLVEITVHSGDCEEDEAGLRESVHSDLGGRRGHPTGFTSGFDRCGCHVRSAMCLRGQNLAILATFEA